MTSTPPAPDLFTYLDHRAWLGDWFAWKKRSNPRYSHRLFASRAGFGSPSLLHLVIKGDRNISKAKLPGFCKALGLTGEAREHFELLVALDRANTNESRTAIFERIRARKHFRAANALTAASFDYLADWTLPTIRELAGAPGFRWDPDWVAARLRPRITPAHARNSLASLEALGLLTPSEDGGAIQLDASVVTPHTVAGLAVFAYHQAMLTQASEALDVVDARDRHYGAVTVRVPTDQVEALKAEVAAFQERILEICDAAESPGAQRVMQLNLQLFPSSHDVEPPCES